VRYLHDAEEVRLRHALKDRDERMKSVRTIANARRANRHSLRLPSPLYFGDHLTPAVLLSANTGLRRGETLKLRWSSVDFSRRLLTVEGQNAKSRQTCHVPLNDEAMDVLIRWREQSGDTGFVFNSFWSARDRPLNLLNVIPLRDVDSTTIGRSVGDINPLCLERGSFVRV
jgi:integrase